MTHQYAFKKMITAAGIAAMLVGGSVFAGEIAPIQESKPAPAESKLWSICNIFDYTTLYKSEDGFIRKIKFVGRYNGQYVDSTTDSNNPAFQSGDRFWEHRRWRFGIQAELANNITFFNNYNLDTSDDFTGGPSGGFINSVEEMHLSWKPNNGFYVTAGKQKPKITREYSTSSKRILTFERSTLVNNVVSDKLWGLTFGFPLFGNANELGIYASSYENSWRWPSFDGADAVLTFRTARPLCESTKGHFDYQFADPSYKGMELYRASPYRHVFSLGTESEWGPFGLVTDVIYAADRDGDANLGRGDDSHGFVVLPSFDITDKLQFVARWAYASDARINRPQQWAGVRPSVDDLHTFYTGLNYRICGDKLKLMAGYEYANAERVIGTTNDYENDTWMFGVRTYW